MTLELEMVDLEEVDSSTPSSFNGLRTLREGRSLQDVAELANVSRAYLNRLERGLVQNPSAKVLVKLSSFYGVSLYQILNELYPDEGPFEDPASKKNKLKQARLGTLVISDAELAMLGTVLSAVRGF